MTTANDILNEARKYLGVTMGSSGHRNIVDTYNSILPLPVGYKVGYHDDWCDTFVSFIGIKTGATSLIGRECGVERHITIFKNMGIWHENGSETPQPGDIICYNWDDGTQPNDGWADHIGFVESVSGGKITTIEGNTSKMVKRRTISVGYGYIRGFARPKYSNGSTPNPGKSISEIAKEVIAGKWSTGADRVVKLKAAGYDPVAVQAEVNRIIGAGSSQSSAKWISENGHFKLSKAINLRKEPKSTSGLIATLKAGATIKYNAYCHVNGYVWIRQVRSDGSYGYLATGNSVNGKRQNYWGTFY